MRHPALLIAARKLRPRKSPLAWVLTDERAGDPAAVIGRLPRQVGVIIRHYDTPDRAAFAARLVGLCKRQRRIVLVAGDERLAMRLRADGVHWPEALTRRRLRPKDGWLVSAAAHGRSGLIRARRMSADQILLSPVFSTRSHPGVCPLGTARAGLMIAGIGMAAIALGGVTAHSARRLKLSGFAGLAAIDGWC